MLNLLRMDIYRIFHKKALYVVFLILVLENAATFAILYAITNPVARDFLLQHGAVITDSSVDIENSLSSLSVLGLYSHAAINGGFFAVTIGILGSLFLCMDFESGFIKNILSAHENRWDYILSKICALGIINFLYLTGTFLITLLLNFVCGNFFSTSSAMDILFFLFSAWMLCNGFSALTLLICMLTRNKAVGVAAAIFINGGVVVSLVASLLSLFRLQWLADYTLYMNLATLTSSFEGNYPWKTALIGIVFLIFYTLISKIVLTKRDI